MKKPPAEGAGSEGDYSECDVASVAWVNRLWLPAGALLLAGLVLGFDWRYIPRPGKSRRPAPEKLESGPTVKRTFPSTLQLFFIGVFLIAVGYVVYLCISADDWKNLGWLGAVIGVAVAGVWACRRLEGWFRFGWGAVLLVAAYLLITWLFSQDWRYGWSAAFFALVILNLGLYPWAQRHFEPSHWDPLTLSRYHRYAPHAALGGLLFFALACLIPGIRSPLIFGCFLLFGVVALYGFFVLFIRRWLPVAIGFFAFLTILAGLQPNHFRFDNLDFYGDKSKLDLEKRIEEELKEANEFDALLLSVKKDLKDAGYFEAKAWLDDFNIKKAELNKLKADLRAPKSESHRKLLEKRVADGEMELDEELASQHEAIKKSALEEVKEKLKKAKGDWVNLENNHRVLPLRVPPEPMRGLVVNWKAKELENNLLPLDHLDYKMGNPLVVVVVSGGGLRSAAWTFAVLQELELQLADKGIDFAKHVRLIAGASGGMLGSSYYVVTLPDGPAGKDDKGLGRQKFLEDKYNRLTQDCLTPVVQQMVLGDIPGFFAPWIAEKDRGKVLEEAWADNLENALDCPFSALRGCTSGNSSVAGFYAHADRGRPAPAH